MPQFDKIAPEWIRLKKPDGHLGALYDPQRRRIRFISRDGTVDYSLALYDQEAKPQTQVTSNGE